MKIKEVQAGVKISKNYNSYSLNLTADIEDTENPEKVGDILIEKATKIINKKVNSGLKEDFKEVGAAWFSKDSISKLSVQYSKDGNWRDVEIKDLKKTSEGYIQKTDEGSFLFKRIPEEKRRNPKMPSFRIYKIKEVEDGKYKKQL